MVSFIVIFGTFFVNSLNLNSNVDVVWLSIAMFVEVEKEITAYDDGLLALIVVIGVFGWYFYMYVSALFTCFPDMVILMYVFP